MRVPFLDLQAVNARYGDELQRAVAAVVASGRYLHGPEVETFEHEWAAEVGTTHCIAVANGLDALRLTLRAWITLGRLNPGDEVIVPANTFIASALAVTDAGLALRLCDVDPRTFNMSLETLQAAMTPATRAVMPVHLYGQLADIGRINDCCQDAGLLVLEDAAQAHGAAAGGRKAGAFGDAAAFSFYPSKNLGALGDAGAVVTDDAQLAGRVRALANYGAAERYRHDHVGLNSRMDEVQAAVLRVKLPFLAADNDARRRIARRYASCQASTVKLPVAPEDGGSHVWHAFVVRTSDREAVAARLLQDGIGTSIHYPHAVHEHRAYRDAVPRPSVAVAESLAREVLSLPIHPALGSTAVTDVLNALGSF
jgi:dTDP-4-amino-4,6-dideoxygalactose transaminase